MIKRLLVTVTKEFKFNLLRRKIFSLLLLVFSLYLLESCSRSSNATDPWMQSDNKIKILSTTRFIDDLVSHIGQKRIVHRALILGELDPHSYEIVKGDLEKIAQADVLFYNGLGLEHGASLRYRIDHHPYSVNIGNYIAVQKPEAMLQTGGQFDPHIWLDVSLWIEAIKPILDTLVKLDPEGKAFYEANARELEQQMQALHTHIQETLAQIPEEKQYLVTSHDAFNYFTKQYLTKPSENWKTRFQAPEGLAPEGQLSTHDIKKIIAYIKRYRIQVLFPESNVSRDALLKIIACCNQSEFPVKIAADVLYADALGPVGSDSEDYFKMMRHNLKVLTNEWTN